MRGLSRADTCVEDDVDWRARKCKKGECDCDWVDSKKKSRRKKRCKKNGSGGVKAQDACCAACSEFDK